MVKSITNIKHKNITGLVIFGDIHLSELERLDDKLCAAV